MSQNEAKEVKKLRQCKQIPNHALVSALRERLQVSESQVCDQELLRLTRGAHMRACVELNLAAEKFRKTLAPALARATENIKKAAQRLSEINFNS